MRSDNWLTGEPCVDEWYGVTCCPETHPRLSADGELCERPGEPSTRIPTGWTRANSGQASRRLQSATLASSSNLTESNVDSFTTCHSASYTGTRADVARCFVVAIALSDNNLRGELPQSMFSELPQLRSVVVRNNSLSGDIPRLSLGLSTFDLRSNSFGYPPPAELRAECLAGRKLCPGFPPISCQAFGPNFVVSTTSSISCVECGEQWFTILMVSLMAALFAGLLGTYILCVKMNDNFVTEGMGTASIIVSHLQTSTIVSRLRLKWPKSTKAAIAFFVVDGFTLCARHTRLPELPL